MSTLNFLELLQNSPAKKKGRRFILPYSKVMLHEPLITGGMGGSATSVKKTAENILEVKALINKLFSRHTGKSAEEIDKATAFDNFMNAEEAIAFGIVDEIKTVLQSTWPAQKRNLCI